MGKNLAAVCVAMTLIGAVPAFAQDGGPSADNVKVRLGPLMMNPTISISNIGIDHNVFNVAPEKGPVQDFTFTVAPNTDLWLRVGRTWVTGSINESINWYQKYAGERTANNEYKLGWNVPTSFVQLKLNGSYVAARERPGFEIDTRAARKTIDFNGSVDFQTLPKTFIGATASRTQNRFADDAQYLGVSLKESLNRITTAYGLTARHTLTPLTTISFALSRSRDGFEFSSDRDTVSTSAMASIALAPAALIKGGASFGYTDFKPTDPSLPAFKGLVGSGDLTTVVAGATRLALLLSRQVQFSYDDKQPYYLQSRIGGSVTQQLFGPFDIQARADYSILEYRDRAGAVIEVANRTDRKTTYGVGIGFHMGKDLRLSVNADQDNRDTKVVDHQYEKFLLGSSLTYGF